MHIDSIFSGDVTTTFPLSTHAFDVGVSGAAAVPSAFGGKAHTCYSLDVSLRFQKGANVAVGCGDAASGAPRGNLIMQYTIPNFTTTPQYCLPCAGTACCGASATSSCCMQP